MKLRFKQPELHKNDVKGQRKLRKMIRRHKNRPNPSSNKLESLLHHGYAPPTGSTCYKRWAWLFRP